MEPLLVISNADAGSTDDRELADALAVLRDGASVEVAATRDPGELDGVLQRAGSRRIVVAGGDGSMHAVVAALHRRNDLADSVLGLVPLGTGNDFARGLDLPLDPQQAARVVLDGTPKPVDLLVDETGQVVVNNVHVGTGAHASRYAARWKRRLGRFKLGKLGYPIGAAIAAVNPPFLRLRVTVDEHVVVDVDRPVLQVALGNGSRVGGGTELNPDADPLDGRIDVMVSRAIGPLSRFGYALHLARGRHDERDDVLSIEGRRVSISGEAFYCSADGEIYGPERMRSWRIEPAAYRLILPG